MEICFRRTWELPENTNYELHLLGTSLMRRALLLAPDAENELQRDSAELALLPRE